MDESIPTLHGAPPPDAPDALAIRADKLDLLERLADALAHEIKNPLHSMVINLEVLRRRLGRAHAEEADATHFADVLGEELERVSRRVELLLRLLRPERGGPEETALGEMVAEVLELVRLEARQRDVRVEYAAPEQIVRVRLGRQAGRQIVLDLVLGALDGTPAGETLRVELRTMGGRVELHLSGRPAGASTARGAVAAALAREAGGCVPAEGGSRALVLPTVGGDRR